MIGQICDLEHIAANHIARGKTVEDSFVSFLLGHFGFIWLPSGRICGHLGRFGP
jgi:hypothetical protein